MRKILKFFKWLVLLFFGSTVLAVVAYKWLPVPVSPLMIIRLGQQLRDGDRLRLVHRWAPLDSISRQLPQAVMASEDQLFLDHHGFDVAQIQKAIEESKAGGRQRGASTISQQTAKNVFLWPGHSWVRKGLEAYFTVLIEMAWGKERIMEVYLNSIEMGKGIYGAEAVAREHFGCSALQLTDKQAALIATSLPNPLVMDSSNPSRYMLRRQLRIMREMRHIDCAPLFAKP